MIITKIRLLCIVTFLTALLLTLTYCFPVPGGGMRAGFLNPFEDLTSTKDKDRDDDGKGEDKDSNNDIEKKDEKDNPIEDTDNIDKTRIPYDLRINTMAYMTCNVPNPDDSFFHLKIGAFHLRELNLFKGGLRLKSSFAEAYDNDSDIRRYPYYEASPFVSFSIRKPLSLPNNRNLFFEFDYSWNLKISREELEDLFDWYDQGYLATFNDKPIVARLKSSNSVDFVTFLDNGRNRLLVGFEGLDSGKPLTYVNPDDDRKYIHGRYYTVITKAVMDHQRRSVNEHSQAVHVLESVEEEYPALIQSSSAEWNCDRQYEIRRNLRSEDVVEDEYLCPEFERPENPSAEYLLVEKVLEKRDGRVSWNINPNEECISPKDSHRIDEPNCYYYPGNTREINKVSTKDSSTCSYDTPDDFCPHFLSICILERD